MTDKEKDVVLTYREACKDYTLGFAGGIFIGAVAIAFVIIFLPGNPYNIKLGLETLFFVFTATGSLVYGIAYTKPIMLYELTGGDD